MRKQNRLKMKIMSIALSAVLAIGMILESTAAAAAENKAPDTEKVIKVACVGDSLTEGYKSSGENNGKKGPNSYPARLQSLLGSAYEVKNFGETGAFLQSGTANPYKEGTEYTESKKYSADIVIIMLGTNDSKSWNADAYKMQAAELYTEYKTENNRVIFATVPQCYQTGGTDITREKVAAVYEMQKELLTANPDWESIDMYAKTEGKERLYNEDKVHFTDTGYLYLAECVYEKITGKRAPIEEKTTIPHTQQSGETNFFTFAEGKWEAGDQSHTWSKAVDEKEPEETWYTVNFTGHKIDIYAGKNRPMGIVEYFVDDMSYGEFDLYNDSNINSTLITSISGLSEGPHVLKAVAAGKKNDKASNTLIDAAQVNVYSYREPKEAKLHGTVVDNNLQYTQDKFSDIENTTVTEAVLTAWKNDTVTSEISLAAIDSSYTNVRAAASDFIGDAGTIPAESVDLQFIKSVQAYNGSYPGYGDPNRPVPQGNREEANEVLYQSAETGMDMDANRLLNIWVSIKVPKTIPAGTYKGTITVMAEETERMDFTYILEVAEAELPDAEEFKDGFDIELWQNPYRIAEYYDVEPFSEEHFAILKPHMELYKNAGGHAITTTIVEEAWAGQTYGETDVKFPSMVQWMKKADGTWKFDYTDFDAWVEFNREVMKIGDKIICYSIAPWTNAVVYKDEATGQKVKQTLNTGSEEWTAVWTTFLNDLADHLEEKGWFEDAYIGIDERGFSKEAFDLIDSIKRGIPTPVKLKSAGAMDHFAEKKDLAMRPDILSVGSMAVKPDPEAFEEIRRLREEEGKHTTIYTCTEHRPGSFSLSAPGESYWTMLYAYAAGGEGYMRWAYDSWVENPLEDTTHNAFEPGDCFLVFPDDSGKNISKSSTRFEKMAEGVRDVNKLFLMKEEIPSLTAEVDALLETIKPSYDVSGLYLTDTAKKEIAADMRAVKEGIAKLTDRYVELGNSGVSEVSEVVIEGDEEIDLQVGKTAELNVKVLPENVLNNKVAWSTSNPAVASVKDGVITGLMPGKTLITAASVQNPEKMDVVTVNVTETKVEEEAQVSYYSFDHVDTKVLEDEWGDRDGTLAESCETKNGKSGKALYVTEPGDGAVIGGSGEYFNDKNWTIAYWVKTESEFDQEISVMEDLEKGFSFSLKMAPDRVSGFRVGDGSGDVLSFGYDFNKDQWYHIAWTQDKEYGLTMYVNGEKVGDTNAWTKNNPIKMPADIIGGTGFTGLIDEVKIYNRVLDAGEVRTVMLVKGLNITETALTVNVGETYQISTNLVTEDEDKTITYISDQPETASVDENGLITAHKKGEAVITVSGGGYTDKITVNCVAKLYPNSTIPQYELADKYLKDIEKKPGTERQYLGQPDMVRTKTGRLITAYPVGHGHGPIVMQTSDDDGETWTEKDTGIPESWAQCQETPTMYTLTLPDGRERIMLISACPNWDLNKGGWETSYSDDNGETWTEYAHFWPTVDGKRFPTIVAMSSLIQLKDENGNLIPKWMGVFHNDSFVNYKSYLTFEEDENGGLVEQWSEPEPYLAEHRDIEQSHQICEAGMFRSPDGERIVALARSQSHADLSTMFYSDDEGETWSRPIEMQGSLAGERHKAVYDPVSGRLVVTFREIIYGEKIDSSWMAGDWVAWVGTYEDLMEQREGEYRILLEQDWAQNAKSGDTGYAGVVVLEDGTFIMDSYGHFDKEFSENAYAEGNYDVRKDLCYIKQAKFKLGDVENENGRIDRTALEEKINEVKDTKAEEYTEDSFKEFSAALTYAQEVLADTSAQQIQIDKAREELSEAFDALIPASSAEPDAPAVTKFEGDADTLAAEGGKVTFTIKGKNLKNGMIVKAGDSLRAETTGTTTEQTAIIIFPENTSGKDVIYHVQYSLDGKSFTGDFSVKVQKTEQTAHEPEKPSDPSADSDQKPDADNQQAVQTGDETDMLFWMILLLTAAGAIAGAGKKKRLI